MILAIILIPVLGGLSVPLLSRVGVKQSFWALILGAAVFITAASCVYLVSYTGITEFAVSLPLGLGIHFYLDKLAAFMAACSSFLSLIIIWYSTGYIHDKEYETEYYSLVLIFLGAMMGLILSANLIWMFVFWEITAICSWRLVGFFRKDQDKKNAVKTFLITVFGALFLMLGIVALYFSNGTIDLTVLKGQHVPAIACILIIAGMFSKSAILPFSTWLPDAGVAPSPITALLHAAVLVKIGVYAYARVFYTINMDPSLATAVMSVAAVSSLIAGGAAIMENNIKRIIAYSTISQLGFIFFALATQTKLGFVAGMLFIMMHGLAKAGLFLCAGIIEHKTHTKDIRQMGELRKVLPATMLCFGLCALSVMGIPPLGGFLSKFMTFNAALQSHSSGLVILAFFIAACFTAAYLLRVFHKVFLDKPASERAYAEGGKEASFQMVSSVSILAVLSLCIIVFANPVVKYLLSAAASMGVK
ncbi:multicomponent Na+:H+ antiporter subunit A [Parelusimicrobium proximum]|uniref:NADH-quinone oxidoreductase subunit 5 family protein n=1 Tax=Parelusimicrobium proximum TaxID=3228953 RepID=UPI003D17F64D